MIEIGLLGQGTVGSGVTKLLEQNKDIISNKLGRQLGIKKVLVKDIKKKRSSWIEGKITDDVDDILDDKDISVVVELMGGEEPALTYIKEALSRGKHVVTANKEVIAKHGKGLLKLAQEKNANLFFEASVAGGIPIIRPLKQCLAANEISQITGILNGTTNYILTQMSEKGQSFDKALEGAQLEGFAEADPTDDVMGHDAARKLAILASIAFNGRIKPDQIYTQGINTIDAADIKDAKARGYVIKLLAKGTLNDDTVNLSVMPMLIKETHMLSNVTDAFNAVLVEGNAVGPLMFYGKGAGMMPTASAVVADIIDVVKCQDFFKSHCTCYKTLKVQDVETDPRRFLVRLKNLAEKDTVKEILKILNENKVKTCGVLTGDEGLSVSMMVSDISLQEVQGVLTKLQRQLPMLEIANIIAIEEE